MTTRPLHPPELSDPSALRKRLQQLGLWGLVAHWTDIAAEPWLGTLIAYEEAERARRSLERRLRRATIGAFKPMADFDWQWPRQIDRVAIEELFGLGFVGEGSNVVLYGDNGIGKTMILKNLAHHALHRGLTARCVTASEMLSDLAAQDSTAALSRRVARYAQPQLLCVDEVGYLSYDSRYADLLFEVVTHRYQAPRSIVLTTNKRFVDWPQVFPNAGCVVTLVDRLLHRCEYIEIDAESYRIKEAKEREAARLARRAVKPATTTKPTPARPQPPSTKKERPR